MIFMQFNMSKNITKQLTFVASNYVPNNYTNIKVITRVRILR